MSPNLKSSLLLLPALFTACSQTPTQEEYFRTGDKMEEATRNVLKPKTFEEFVGDYASYRSSRDMWRGAAIERCDPRNSKVIILLKEQRGRLYINGQIAMDFPACTGAADGHETPRGTFRITEKNREHRSSLYGSFIDASGSTVQSGVTSTDKAPTGTHFEGTLMPYWMRFNGAIGMHTGSIYREGASHGCVRIPPEACSILFDKLTVGSVVEVR